MDRAALIEMLRGLVGDPPPEAPEVQIPSGQPAEPVREIPIGQPAGPVVVDARHEKRVDWVRALSHCDPPHFSGGPREDIEAWLR